MLLKMQMIIAEAKSVNDFDLRTCLFMPVVEYKSVEKECILSMIEDSVQMVHIASLVIIFYSF